MRLGITLTDVPASRPATEQFADIRRLVEAAQRNGFKDIAIGQHFLYGDLRWLQPIPLLARLAADVEADVRLITNILVAPLYNPIMLAEDIATLDIVTEGRYVFGVGLGYRKEEFDALGIPHKERAPRLDEMLVLMKKLWTEDEVTFDGRFWKLDGVRPHLRPVQDPHPPIWVGGVALAGARRAGRLADGYVTNPEAEEHEIAERMAVVKEERALRGLPMIPQPLRRNIMLGKDRDDATQKYMAVSQDRYQAYAARGLDVFDQDALTKEFADTVSRHAILGTSEDCIEQLTGLASRYPIDPFLLRPQWPQMPTQDAIDLMDELGKEVVPAMQAVRPLRDLPA
jgi:alkanesulfonate monooxygenase SsuD/methylene tetrahydromethanopterin reductase-like flavin-dependent oxidoreductase (luciferase family)